MQEFSIDHFQGRIYLDTGKTWNNHFMEKHRLIF